MKDEKYYAEVVSSQADRANRRLTIVLIIMALGNLASLILRWMGY